MTTVLVGTDMRELELRARSFMDREDDRGDVAPFLDQMRATRLVGTPNEVLERLADYAKAGVQRVYLQDLLHDDLEMIELLGRDVVPEAARLDTAR
jgi:alkanesulfonate monooxygenase SsuD/methylene tetrahydromethanopterin reductase-like flavin-dependent oxidoreductase (luciferase family)